MDGHVGCQLWQQAALQTLGVEATVLSLRRRTRPVDFPLSAAERKIRERMKFLWWRTWPKRNWSATDGKLLALASPKKELAEVFEQCDIFLGAYPPTVGRLLMDLARRYKKRVILNLANRFAWEKSPRRIQTFTDLLKQIHASEQHTLAVMGEYDRRYVAHYLGLEAAKLYTACHHLPLRQHQPTCDTVLVGPARPPHNPRIRTGPFASTADLNARYQKWRIKNGRANSMRFAEIRTLYPQYTLDDLAQHPAVVIFPHSAYAISMAELYEMNMPFFVPSAEVCLQHGMPHEVFAHRYNGAPHAASRRPHSFHADEKSMAHWLRFCFFQQTENAVVWNSPEDLFRKLSEYDLPAISAKMYNENKKRRAESLRCWAEVLANPS